MYKKINYKNSNDLIKFMNAVALPCIGFNSGKFDKIVNPFWFVSVFIPERAIQELMW